MKNSALTLNEVSLLTGSIETVLRLLIRLLVGKISFERLQELVQNIFVEEAENALREKRPGREVTLSKLALLTGLDTRKLARIRNDKDYRKSMGDTKEFISRITPVKCVTELWRSDTRFVVEATGKPRVLDVYGEGDSFEAAVRESVKARGITIKSIIESLLEQDEAELIKDDKIKLKEKQSVRKKDREQVSRLFAGLNATASLLSTVNHNLRQKDEQSLPRYQWGSWTHRLPAARRHKFAEELYQFLESCHEGALQIMQKYEEKNKADNQITAGINLFYFESPVDHAF